MAWESLLEWKDEVLVDCVAKNATISSLNGMKITPAYPFT